VGAVEAIVYVTAILGNALALIGFWLVLKAVVVWSPWTKVDHQGSAAASGRHLFNIFLIGTGLSLFFGAVGGFLGLAILSDRYGIAAAAAACAPIVPVMVRGIANREMVRFDAARKLAEEGETAAPGTSPGS
jgi:hypothetical protein